MFSKFRKNPAQKAFANLSKEHRKELGKEYKRQHSYETIHDWLIGRFDISEDIETPEAKIIAECIIWVQSEKGFKYWESVSTHYISLYMKKKYHTTTNS